MSTLASAHSSAGTVLVTGATGYVGGRLLRALAGQGRQLRAIARRPQHLSPAARHGAQVVQADLLDRPSLDAALAGVHTAYYLVHSMGAGADYARLDRAAARNFQRAAEVAGVQRIVYLGGLGDRASQLSRHLGSRQEVGDLLRAGSVQVVELRASIVLGSGSLSFELVRALSERLPVMVTPRWVGTMAQPIAIEDLLRYLTLSCDQQLDGHQLFEIGGPDRVSYRDLMRVYARQRGLRRLLLPVPVLTPRLSSLWLGLVTPLYARVGRALIDGIRNPTLVHDQRALETFDVRPMGVEQAIARALHNEDQEHAETRWSDAASAAGAPRSWAGVRFGNRLVDHRELAVDASPAQAFAPIRQIGGERGWYYATWLWILRGWIDLLLGGVGLRRGRRDPGALRPGEVLDFWRVEAVEPNRLLRLRAEMRLPGRAWLQWEVVQTGGDAVVVHQTAIYDPVGVLGLAYWYLVYPLHALIFAGMLRAIARRGRALAGARATGPECGQGCACQRRGESISCRGEP